MAANGTALNPGQTSLVRQMCSSATRLHLAIAPAGAGKTTATPTPGRCPGFPEFRKRFVIIPFGV
jgi:hypothetical protein